MNLDHLFEKPSETPRGEKTKKEKTKLPSKKGSKKKVAEFMASLKSDAVPVDARVAKQIKKEKKKEKSLSSSIARGDNPYIELGKEVLGVIREEIEKRNREAGESGGDNAEVRDPNAEQAERTDAERRAEAFRNAVQTVQEIERSCREVRNALFRYEEFEEANPFPEGISKALWDATLHVCGRNDSGGDR